MSVSVYIVAACRSPIGNHKGQFGDMSIIELAKPVLQAAVERSGLKVTDIDDILIGNVLSAGKGQNPARQAALNAQLPIDIPATTISMLCGSGLKSVVFGFNAIRTGDSKIVLCGGMESMTQAEHTIFMRGNPTKIGDACLKDTLLCDGLNDAVHHVHMGRTAEEVARRFTVSRQAQDEYALRSQQKTAVAQREGYFSAEIIPISHTSGKVFDKDEFPRNSTTIESLAKLKPAFSNADGSVTPGNSSGINDGAAMLVLADSFEVKSRNLVPLAKIIGYAEVGIDPLIMGVAPIEAIKKLLEKISWSIQDVDLFEVNEAFASQSIVVAKTLGIPDEKLNVSGGAIALGHPIGCSGARVLVTLVHNLRRLGKKRGVCSLCIGGGMGIALAVENPDA